MYSRTTLGNFYPVSSIIHKLNPINKVFCLVLYLIFLIFNYSLKLHFIEVAFFVFIMMISNVPFRFYFNIIFKPRYILLFIIFVLLLSGVSLEMSVIMLIKIITTIIILCILTFTTSPSELMYGIEKFLNLFNIFNLRLSKLSNKIVNLIRFYPLFISTEYQVLKAIETRGVNYYKNNILNKFLIRRKIFKSVFVITKRKINDIKNEAMIRMFSLKKFRTNFRVNKFSFYDLVYLIFHLFLIFTLLYEKGVFYALFN